MSENDMQAVIETAQMAATPRTITRGDTYCYQGRVIDTEALLPAPRRMRGETIVRDIDSFKALWMKLSDPGSVTYLNPDAARPQAIGVLDHVDEIDTGWQDHRLVMPLAYSPEWQDWTRNDGKSLSQLTFAEFIEDQLPCLVDPAPAEMLEVITSMQATRDARFESGIRLQDGSVRFQNSETIKAQAGKDGALVIPAGFTIGIPVFEGRTPFKIQARLRYRLDEGRLMFTYKLNRLVDVLRAEFASLRTELQAATGAPVVLGLPNLVRVATP